MPFPSPYGDIVVPSTPLHDVLYEKIDEVIAKDPTKKALLMGANPDDFVTYSQLRSHGAAIAQFLHNRGFSKQTACTVVGNCHQFVTFFFGVSIQGGATSGASALFTDYELQQQFKDSRCTAVLCDLPHLKKVQKAVEGSDTIKTIVVVGATKGQLPSGSLYYTWQDAVGTLVDSSRTPVPIDIDEDVVLLPYSSGTTGSPKGVMLTHRNFVAMCTIFVKWLHRMYDLEPWYRVDWYRNSMLLFLPFYHIYGFGMICHSILEASTTVVLSGFDPNLFCACIEKYKICQINIVPPILVFLTKSPICAKYDLSSLKKISTGAAPAGKDLCDEAKRKYPHITRLEQGYGMTEVSMASHLPNPQSRAKFGCVGKLAAGLLMKIVNVETGEELSPGKAGEICIKGPTVMKGYLGRPEATRETIREGWLHTGDIGYNDADGDLFIVDRLKELIKVKGLQVPPAELEDLLLSHSRIADCAVIGVPDKDAGELPKAYVVRADPKLTEKEVFNYVAEKVSKYKHLHGGIEFIDIIPKSASGKILRKELRAKNNKAKI